MNFEIKQMHFKNYNLKKQNNNKLKSICFYIDSYSYMLLYWLIFLQNCKVSQRVTACSHSAAQLKIAEIPTIKNFFKNEANAQSRRTDSFCTFWSKQMHNFGKLTNRVYNLCNSTGMKVMIICQLNYTYSHIEILHVHSKRYYKTFTYFVLINLHNSNICTDLLKSKKKRIQGH